VRIRTKGREDAADVGILKRIGYLDPEESEADVPHLPKCKFRFLHFLRILVTVFQLSIIMRI
jgi:hypothetical protein